MTEDDQRAIAKFVVSEFKAQGTCPNGMDQETVNCLKGLVPELKEFIGLYRKGKMSVWIGFWGFVALGLVSLFLAGIIEKLRN